MEYVAKTPGAAYIPAFDHPYIWDGHSTIIDELRLQFQHTPYSQHPISHPSLPETKPDAIVVPVGGGGLLAGILQGMQRHGWVDIPVLAMETHGSNSFQMSNWNNSLLF